MRKKKMNKTLSLILLISFTFSSLYAKKIYKSDEEKILSSFAGVKEKEVIIIKGKDMKGLTDSFKEALQKLDEQESKQLLKAVSIIIQRDISEEKKTLINRKLTKSDLSEIKFNAINGKTVLNLIGEANVIEEKKRKEEEARIKRNRKKP
jgi:hypothetical protein